jgi:hypothetical protein
MPIGAKGAPFRHVTRMDAKIAYSPQVKSHASILDECAGSIPMAMPPAHVIALCSDLGMTPAKGAAMLTVMLVCAFVARQFWGRYRFHRFYTYKGRNHGIRHGGFVRSRS